MNIPVTYASNLEPADTEETLLMSKKRPSELYHLLAVMLVDEIHSHHPSRVGGVEKLRAGRTITEPIQLV